jgi:hypothetical protein
MPPALRWQADHKRRPELPGYLSIRQFLRFLAAFCRHVVCGTCECAGVYICTPDGGAQQRPVGIFSNPVRCDSSITAVPRLGVHHLLSRASKQPRVRQPTAYRAPGSTLCRGLRGASSGVDFARTAPLRWQLSQRPVRQRPQVTLCTSASSSPVAGTIDVPAARAQRARSRASRPTGSKPLLTDESIFAGGQPSDLAIQQILVRSQDSCTSVELTSYAAQRATNQTLASTRGSVGCFKHVKKLVDIPPSSDRSSEER